MKDLSFLEFKDTDSEELRGMKSYWQMVMDMPEPERKVFLQEERVKDEESYLKWMVTSNHQDDESVHDYKHRARSAVLDYNMLKETQSLEIAKSWMDMAESTKQTRFTIGDIRKQRERVQWEKKKLKMLQQQNEKPSTSSNS